MGMNVVVGSSGTLIFNLQHNSTKKQLLLLVHLNVIEHNKDEKWKHILSLNSISYMIAIT